MGRQLLLLLGVATLASACAFNLGPGSPTPWPRVSPAKHYDVSTNPNEAILRIDWSAGPPMSAALGFMPSLALYGDGRVIEPSGLDSFVPWLSQYHVTPDEIQLILAAADEAGLLGPDATYYDRDTTLRDGGWTSYTVSVGGRVHRIDWYESGRSDDEALNAAVDRLVAFQYALNNLGFFLGREITREPYEPPSIRVFSSRHDAAATMMVWPLDVDLATAGQPTHYQNCRCIVVSGSDLTKLLAATETADWDTIWTDGKTTYTVMTRPIFPDESGCPAP